jgi:hypothetical protein
MCAANPAASLPCRIVTTFSASSSASSIDAVFGTASEPAGRAYVVDAFLLMRLGLATGALHFDYFVADYTARDPSAPYFRSCHRTGRYTVRSSFPQRTPSARGFVAIDAIAVDLSNFDLRRLMNTVRSLPFRHANATRKTIEPSTRATLHDAALSAHVALERLSMNGVDVNAAHVGFLLAPLGQWLHQACGYFRLSDTSRPKLEIPRFTDSICSRRVRRPRLFVMSPRHKPLT